LPTQNFSTVNGASNHRPLKSSCNVGGSKSAATHVTSLRGARCASISSNISASNAATW